MSRVLVVDDDASILGAFGAMLRHRGYEVETAGSAETALERLDTCGPDVIVIDVGLPGMDGLATLRHIKTSHPWIPVIVITGAGTMDLAIEASRLGAFDYQLKPFEPARMLELLTHATESGRGARSGHAPVAANQTTSDDLMIGDSAAMQEVYKAIGRVAATDVSVLIRGESGTGKELVARAIHRYSRRSRGPLVPVNCMAIPETLLESELFGHERGSFSGAVARHLGTFERAAGGTVLLDEIGDVPLAVQGKILRVLQERRFERVGGTDSLPADVRILSATHRNIEAAIARGAFREDLYHRLDVVTIHVPALRERREDVPVLARTFLARFARELGKETPPLEPDALEVLSRHPWPGNVRQLEHCMKRTLLLTRGFPIRAEAVRRALERSPTAGIDDAADIEQSLREIVRAHLSREAGPGCEPSLMDRVARELLVEALRRCGGNQSRAAELLGIPRPTLHARLRKLGVRTNTVVEPGA